MFLDRAIPEYSDEEKVQRKDYALRLLRDPFFQSIMEQAENDAISTWLRNTDPAARERCWLLCKGLDTVMLTLQQVVGDAPMEKNS